MSGNQSQNQPGEREKPALLIPPEVARRKIDEQIEKGRELKNTRISSSQELSAAKNRYSSWNSYNTEMLRRMFTTEEIADQYSTWYAYAIRDRNLAQDIEEFFDDVDDKIHRLESLRERLELFPVAGGATPQLPGTESLDRTRVFVVHGHDEGARETIARFLGDLGLEPVILHEQASGGRTIVEKLEHYGDVHFAVVLLTPDDVGASRDQPDKLQPRARQNVVMELGYFLGRLGRSRVCALHRGEMELPSDILGVVWVRLDADGGWKVHLARELRQAGFTIDFNKAL